MEDERAAASQAAASQAAEAIVAPADFEDAFREHFAPVYRFIARRVGTALAEDLAAEAFATAYRRRASYEPVARLAAVVAVRDRGQHACAATGGKSSNCSSWTRGWRRAAEPASAGYSPTRRTSGWSPRHWRRGSRGRSRR